MPLFRFLLLISSLLLGLAAPAVQARDTQVLFIAASPVQPGEFVNLERLARAQGSGSRPALRKSCPRTWTAACSRRRTW